MITRLYFNQSGELPWSLDNGDQSTEHNYSQVEIHNLAGTTMFLTNVDRNPNTPVAWIQFYDAEVKVSGTTAVVRRRRP